MTEYRPAVNGWLTNTITERVALSKEKHANWSTAVAVVDSVQLMLLRFGQLYVSEPEDIKVFLLATAPDKKTLFVDVVSDSPTEEKFVSLRRAEGRQPCRETVAAFLCDFPDAVFSAEGGIPLVLMGENSKQKSQAVRPGKPMKRYLSLNAMLDMIREGMNKFALAMPKGPEDTKNKDSVKEEKV